MWLVGTAMDSTAQPRTLDKYILGTQILVEWTMERRKKSEGFSSP